MKRRAILAGLLGVTGAALGLNSAARVHAEESAAFVAHLGEASTQEAALEILDKVREIAPGVLQGKEPFVHPVGLEGGETSHRLRLGPPMTLSQAENLCSGIRAAGHEACQATNVFELAAVRPGYFGDLHLKPLKDGRKMQVLMAFGFIDSQARKWEVPAGSVTDGASIPRAFWSLIGSPFAGKFRLAAVVHDHYCATKIRSWVDTHNAFYDAMIASGEGVNRARVMWAAVYRFGPRWAQNQSVCWGVCADNDAYLEDVDVLPTFNQADFRKIKSHVERNKDKALSELAEFIDQNAEQSSSGARLRGVLQDINGDRGPVDFKAPNNWYYYGNFRRAPRILPIYETVNVAPKESLNVHGGPGSQFPIVGRIPSDGRGLRLVVPCGRAAWCQVRHGETEGWVESSFIRIDPELSTLEH